MCWRSILAVVMAMLLGGGQLVSVACAAETEPEVRTADELLAMISAQAKGQAAGELAGEKLSKVNASVGDSADIAASAGSEVKADIRANAGIITEVNGRQLPSDYREALDLTSETAAAVSDRLPGRHQSGSDNLQQEVQWLSQRIDRLEQLMNLMVEQRTGEKIESLQQKIKLLNSIIAKQDYQLELITELIKDLNERGAQGETGIIERGKVADDDKVYNKTEHGAGN